MDFEDRDFIVVGSGLAGLVASLRLSRHGSVALVTKGTPEQSNTSWAQGGLACVVDPEDRFEDHVRDTLGTGAGLSDESVVDAIVRGGPDLVHELEGLGVQFERAADGGYDLGQEAGHSCRRVLHAGDITGRELTRALLNRVQSETAITIFEQHMAIDLVTKSWLRSEGSNRCVGLYALRKTDGTILGFRGKAVVLATGGAGKVYLYTSNPDVATGDGMAMAWRAGLPMMNMEFVQFHPTCLFHRDAKSFLISEAVRGEGAVLVNADREPFTERFDPRGSLAPRDIVARAIDDEIKRRGDKCVYLDITHRDRDFLVERFPNIYSKCLSLGIDMATDLIPVVPAAHYFCGGVSCTVRGQTALPGLYVCGETGCTGLHGANRLASNSLLEALVCGVNTAEQILADTADQLDWKPHFIPAWEYGAAVASHEAVVVEHNWAEVRTCMWDYVGIVRTQKRLERALRRIRNMRMEIREYYLDYLVTADVLELRNLADVAELVVRSAMKRHESRGLHYTLDYLDVSQEEPSNTLLRDPPGGPVRNPHEV